MGALGHAAEQPEDPNDQAGILLAGVASRVKKGLMTQEEAAPIVAGLMGDDGQPDPEKVKGTIARLKAASKEQRTLADTDTRAAANAENAATSKAQRDEITAERKQKTALTNYASQLTKTTSQAQYARVYAGIPDDLKPYFDAPEEWTPQSRIRANDALLTPEQREAKRTRDINEVDKAAAAAETKRYHDATIAARNRGIDVQAGKTGKAGAATSNAGEVREYNAFVKSWTERYPKPAGANAFDADGNPKPAPPAPPSLQKWSVMTPAERERVLSEPGSRIDDAEMLKLMGEDVPETPTGGTAPKPAPIQGSAKPGAGKMIKADALKALAKQWNMDEEDARAEAIKLGFALVK
jgi:hypothetical protein